MIITLLTLFLLFVNIKRVFKETQKILAIYRATGFGSVKKLRIFNIIYIIKKTFIEWSIIFVLMISLFK